MSQPIPRGILRIFNTEESRDKNFKKDVDVMVHNEMKGCMINQEAKVISMGGQHWVYRSPTLGIAVKEMPLDKIEIVEQINDLAFIGAAMQAIETTRVSAALQNQKKSLVLKGH